MTIHLFDTMAGATRELVPLEPGHIRIYTCGPEGMLVSDPEPTLISGVRLEGPTDPTGAGDCFDAGFLCGLLEQRSITECARLGAAVGALCAQTFGPMEGNVNPDAVARLLNQR